MTSPCRVGTLYRASGHGRPRRATAGQPVSASGLVAGARQAKRSQTYTASRPSTSPFPASSGTSSDGPTATTLGANGASARVRRPSARGRRSQARAAARDGGRERRVPRRTLGEPAPSPAQAGARRLAARDHRIVAPDPAEAHEHRRHHRVPGRDRIVVEVLERAASASPSCGARKIRARPRRARSGGRRSGAPRGASRTSPVATCSTRPWATFAWSSRKPPPLTRPSRMLLSTRPSSPRSGPRRKSPTSSQSSRSRRLADSASAASEAVPGRDRLVVAKRLRPLRRRSAGAPWSGRRGHRARSSGRARTARARGARARAPPSPPGVQV